MFMSLWSPQGTFHENILAAKAKKLVVDHGWTFAHPDESKPLFRDFSEDMDVEYPEEPYIPAEDDDEGDE